MECCEVIVYEKSYPVNQEISYRDVQGIILSQPKSSGQEGRLHYTENGVTVVLGIITGTVSVMDFKKTSVWRGVTNAKH